MIRKKIVILGDFAVGKTSLIRRYVDGSFDDKYLTTIGVKISKKLVTIDEVDTELIIWDIEGKTPSKSIPSSYYKGASGAIFVTSVNRSDTLISLKSHIDTFLHINPKAKYLIAHNKADLLDDAQKDEFILNSYSFLTSAKSSNNVEMLFSKITRDILL
ncbi:MAG: Rab family GTPase [Sulfurovum sp.]